MVVNGAALRGAGEKTQMKATARRQKQKTAPNQALRVTQREIRRKSMLKIGNPKSTLPQSKEKAICLFAVVS